MENANHQYGERKRPRTPEEIDQALRSLHMIFASMYRKPKAPGEKPVRVFPAAFAVGLFHNVIAAPMSLEEVQAAAIAYGEAQLN
jgi:hypothetical protein